MPGTPGVHKQTVTKKFALDCQPQYVGKTEVNKVEIIQRNEQDVHSECSQCFSLRSFCDYGSRSYSNTEKAGNLRQRLNSNRLHHSGFGCIYYIKYAACIRSKEGGAIMRIMVLRLPKFLSGIIRKFI